jgi:hypothetical protein
MIILNNTDNLQVTLSSSATTSQLECFASYRDTTSSTITPGRSFTNTNNITAVNLVTSPSVSTQRVVDYISIYNSDTSSINLIVQLDVSGTPYILINSTLLPNEKLEYQEGDGFKSLDVSGALKLTNVMGYNSISGISSVVLSTDVINNNVVANTIADITGLSFSVVVNKTYWFKFTIPFTTPVATTGCRFSINGPTTSALYYYSYIPTGTGTITTNLGLSSYDSPAAATSASPNTFNAVAIVEGIVTFTANGTFIGRFASEVSSSAVTAKAGSIVQYKQLD